MDDFLVATDARILVSDGAVGTMLHAMGHAFDGALAALNVERPEVVAAIHESYVDAGADVIQTNTFGANRLRLALHGSAEHVREINVAGGTIAREIARGADHPVFVAGSISPAVTAGQRARVYADERVLALREQMEALHEAGVDLLVLETFGYLDELVEAVEIAAELGLPVVAQATFAEDGLTLSGHSAVDVAKTLSDTPVDMIGVNCTVGPRKLVPIVASLAETTSLPLSVQPNAGRPGIVASEHQVRFGVDAEYFAGFVRPFVEAGAVLVGGCCGTTPAMIRAIAEQAATLRPTRRHRHPTAPRRRGARPHTLERPTPLVEQLASGEFLVAVELPVQHGGTVDDALGFVSRFRRRGIELFFIPSEARMAPRSSISPLSLAIALGQRANIEPIMAVATWHKSVMALQAEMLGAHALQVHNVVCETGDQVPVGDYPVRDDAWETDSLELVALLSTLNGGRDSNGLELRTHTEFVIGARANLGHDDVQAEIRRVLTKARAGTQFVLTEPLYETTALDELHRAVGEDGELPVLATIRPLPSEDEAAYLYHEVPDVRIPRASLEALRRAGVDAGRRGVELADALLRSIRPLVRGVVLSAERADHLDPLVDVALELRAQGLTADGELSATGSGAAQP